LKVPRGVNIERDSTILSLEKSIQDKLNILAKETEKELPQIEPIKNVGLEEALKELLALENGANITQNLTANNL
jgi:hypothetical protein